MTQEIDAWKAVGVATIQQIIFPVRRVDAETPLTVYSMAYCPENFAEDIVRFYLVSFQNQSHQL